MLFVNRHIARTLVLALLAMITIPATAQRTLQHYLDVSVGGGVAMGMSTKSFVKDKIGADGQIGFAYEMAKHRFFFNIGVGADYVLTCTGVDNFVDSYARVDKDGRAINYRYIYSDYVENEHLLMGSASIELGYRFHRYGFFGVGAKVSFPFVSDYSTKTKLYTEGVYTELIQPVSRNVPSYGYYPEIQYKDKGSFTAPDLYIAPMAEVGGVVPIQPGIICRIGLFCEYMIPVVGSYKAQPILDYSAVNLDPNTQNQEDLIANLHMHPIVNGNFNRSVLEHGGEAMMKRMAENLTIGIRCTFRFNVSRSPSICNCVTDN